MNISSSFPSLMVIRDVAGLLGLRENGDPSFEGADDLLGPAALVGNKARAA